MRSLYATFGVFASLIAIATPMKVAKRSTSNSWMGSNLYFLQGLSDADQDNWIDTLASYGAKAVRVWVNAQSGPDSCVKGSKLQYGVPDLEANGLGNYSVETLDLLDRTLVKLAAKGLKAFISPHDGNALNDDYRCDAYCKRWGAGYFYEQAAAATQYDQRLDYILNYKGATSGKVWKDWSDAIAGFDVQNEPFSAKEAECSSTAASSWICGRAQYLRGVLGDSNPIKISSGGMGGDFSNGCTFSTFGTSCSELDMIAVHRYPGSETANPDQWSANAQSWLAQADDKLLYVEEWGLSAAGSVSQSVDFPAQTDDLALGGLPNLYWQILPPVNPDCPYDAATDGDPFGIFMDSGIDFAAAFEKASSSPALQDWSSVV